MSGRVAVIGAGMAGLSCARRLQAEGIEVVVFDKSRGPGGRACTRRVSTLTFDHGAPAIDATGAELPDALRSSFAMWMPRRGYPTSKGLRALPGGPLWVPRPKMSVLGRSLSRPLTLHLQSRVTRLQPTGTGWGLYAEERLLGHFDWVVLACPAAQAAALLPAGHSLHESVQAVRYLPSWVTMAIVDGIDEVGFDWIEGAGEACVRAIRENSKPGRRGLERWVLHSSPTWAGAHLDTPAEKVGGEMLRAFVDAVAGAHVRDAWTHRWLYAHTLPPTGTPTLSEPHTQLALCGDAYRQPGLLGAWHCGREAAGDVMAHLASRPSHPRLAARGR
jgi:predicted NAD/FAD-dependent oxidoreductase